LRLNGQTSGYDFVNGEGTETTNASEIALNDGLVSDGKSVIGQLVISGRWDGSPAVGMHGSTAAYPQKTLQSGGHRSATSPLDQITFRGRSGTTSVVAEVFGRDIA